MAGVCCAREFWRLKSHPEKGQPWALRGGVDGCGCVIAGCECYCVSSSTKKLTGDNELPPHSGSV